jgi:hypothetical protein
MFRIGQCSHNTVANPNRASSRRTSAQSGPVAAVGSKSGSSRESFPASPYYRDCLQFSGSVRLSRFPLCREVKRSAAAPSICGRARSMSSRSLRLTFRLTRATPQQGFSSARTAESPKQPYAVLPNHWRSRDCRATRPFDQGPGTRGRSPRSDIFWSDSGES